MPRREKVAPPYWHRVVRYSEAHWRLLADLRRRAVLVMEALAEYGIRSFVYGSVARGDVSPTSDVDVAIPFTPSTVEVETALEPFGILEREIIMATPMTCIKGVIHLRIGVDVEFPLSRMSRIEEEFFRYAGLLSLPDARDPRIRVKGVNKRLCLIRPLADGHEEMSILGREAEVARELGISIETVLDRVQALTRRDALGRTGIFWRYSLAPDESFEDVLAREASRNPAVRKKLRE